MSRTDHTLRSVAWWRDWARWFTRENRKLRRFGRRRREREAERLARAEIDKAERDR